MIKVVVKKGQHVVVEKELGEYALTIGSAKGSEILLASDEIAPEQATVSKLGKKVLIEAHEKTPPVLLNGEPVTSVFLEDGDRIKIGEFDIEILTSHGRTASEPLKDDPDQTPQESEPDTAVKKTEPENPALKEWLKAEDEDKRTPEKTLPRKRGGEEIAVNTALREARGTVEDGKRTRKIATDPSLGFKGRNEETQSEIESSDSDRVLGSKGRDSKAGRTKEDTLIVPLSVRPRLYLVNFKAKDRFIDLEGERTVLGRGESCDVVLKNPSVSSKHATIEAYENDFKITDHGSTNGTTVNGEPVVEKSLKCHDIIGIGDVKLEFLEGGAEPSGERETFDPYKRSRESITKGPKLYRDGKKQTKAGRPGLYMFALAAVIAGLFIIFLARQRPPRPPSVSPLPSPTKPLNEADLEKQRVAMHNLARAKRFLEEKNYEEAKNALKIIVDGVDPENAEARQLIDKIQKYQDSEKKKRDSAEREKRERQARISGLLAEGERLFEQKRFAESRARFEGVLKIDQSNSIALKFLNDISVKEASIEREKRVLEENLKLVESLYYQGISYYEEGNYDEAGAVLRRVVEYRTTSFYESASKILERIEKKQLADIDEQLLEVDGLVKNDELIKAENILRSILKRFPKSSKARSIYNKVHKELTERAKKVYSEGLVYENVVDDVPAAVESYKEVIRLLPNPAEEYHKKAKARLERLK